MSQNKLMQDCTKVQLERMQLDTTIKLLVSDPVLDKIKYLCHKIADVEWSGVLFYSIEGSIKDPKNMVCKVEDILPMDKGSKAYTEYNLDNRFVEYLMDNPLAMTWKIGHIHSHNSMSTFFSGTDLSELNDNIQNHNFYLSLIVNNAMEFTAKIALKAIMQQSLDNIPFISKDENGNDYSTMEDTLNVIREKMIMYNCNIEYNKPIIHVPKDFSERVEGIIKKREEDDKKMKREFIRQYPKTPTQSFPTIGTHKVDNKEPRRPWMFHEHLDMFNEIQEPLEDVFEEEELTDVEQFCMDLFETGNDSVETLIDCLEYISVFNVSGQDIASHISEHYNTLFEANFPNTDSNYFIVITEEVITLLSTDSYVEFSDILDPVLNYLKNMLNKFIKDYDNTAITSKI